MTPTTAAPAGDALRRAMRHVASSVAVVTTHSNGDDHGMTVTSFASVSLDPPLVLVVINTGASLHAPLVGAEGFCVNILDESQIDVALAFARPGEGALRFNTGDWRRVAIDGLSQPTPVLQGAQAWIACALDTVVSAGTHSIITGRVLQCQTATQGAPLLYLDGAFRTLAGAAQS